MFKNFPVTFACLAALFSVYQALKIEDNRPGAIPVVYDEVVDVPGGWLKIAWQARLVMHAELDRTIKELEAIDAMPGAPRHKLMKIPRATIKLDQRLKKVVFVVGQLNKLPPLEEIDENGQYGECYMKLYYPPNKSSPEVQEHRCVKITKQEADERKNYGNN
uniref:Uncharacterized protein n=1 Tax=Romanomermis culicivorax TaxID=13658 RepID=A0A915IKM4_ROMCU